MNNIKTREQFEQVCPFAVGAPNDGFAQYFIGRSYLNVLTPEGAFCAHVTFEPGCRNNWHIHRASSGGGQILLCTGGMGWYCEEGKAPRTLRPGDTVFIAPGVKHWHGAAKDSWFGHISVEIPGVDGSNEWLEPVSDEEYAKTEEIK